MSRQARELGLPVLSIDGSRAADDLATGAASIGKISGGAFNPAVAFGASVMGLFSWPNIWIYLLADFTGGAAAAITFRYLNPVT